MSKTEYWRIWFVILGAAAVSFLSMTPFIFVAGIALGAIVTSNLLGMDVKGRLASFWLLLLLFPPITFSLDGFAGINRLVDLSHQRVLVLMLLLPAALSLLGNREIKIPSSMRWMDVLVLSYPVMKLVTAIPTSPLTVTLRMSVETFLDLVLPYYVTTRGLRSASDLKFVMAPMALGFVYLALVGLLESTLRKNFYSELQFIYGVRWQLTHVLMRGPFLRIQATTPQPIVMAFLMLCAFGMWSWLRATGTVLASHGRLVALIIFAAFFATWSRGPLLGFVGFLLCLAALRRMMPMKFMVLVCLIVVAGGAATASGADSYVYTGLKALFGSAEADVSSIDYRRKLLEMSLALIEQSPIWGVPNYAMYMQDLRQGEGIIDLVNTYLAVTLSAGVVGLVFFLSPHLLVLYRLLKTIGPASERPRLLGGSFPIAFASLTIAALFVIFTMSDFSFVSSMLLFIIAVPTAWLAMSQEEQKKSDAYEAVTESQNGRRLPIPAYIDRGAW
ncbi:MAG: O-antigen ligase family protein [Pseudomonadota bacterium]|nr:O-antigen ligase family protein [Pseudomonadota bacterium]